jgi:hypothetical protein
VHDEIKFCVNEAVQIHYFCDNGPAGRVWSCKLCMAYFCGFDGKFATNKIDAKDGRCKFLKLEYQHVLRFSFLSRSNHQLFILPTSNPIQPHTSPTCAISIHRGHCTGNLHSTSRHCDQTIPPVYNIRQAAQHCENTAIHCSQTSLSLHFAVYRHR